MTWQARLILAQTEYVQLARLQAMTQWWHWLALVGGALLLAALVVGLYRRDARELPRPTRWTLLAFRLAALAGVLLFFLGLEKRTQQRMVNTSRVAVLVDTSQSMGLRDTGPDGSRGSESRLEEAARRLRQGSLLPALRADHDVAVYRFDEAAQPELLASLPKTGGGSPGPRPGPDRAAERAAALARSRRAAAVAGGLFLLAILAAAAGLTLGRLRPTSDPERAGWLRLAAALSLIAAVVVLATAHLASGGAPLPVVLGLEEPAWNGRASGADALQESGDAGDDAQPDEAWFERLEPRGVETRLGDVLMRLISQERGGPIAGVILVTDGRNNAGLDPETAAAAAREAGIPLLAVGVGSDRPPVNVRLADIEAPPRVFPGDEFPITGYVQAFGLAGRTVQVDLYSAPAAADVASQGRLEESAQLRLGEDGRLTPVRFRVAPGEPGRRTFQLRVAAPQEDQESGDNAKSVEVAVVSRKNRVLLIAGGPSREYRFLRTLLYRDRDTELSVWLQSGLPGMAQEADELLLEFPQTAAELFKYDAIVAFDPDWLALGEEQIELLEQWVSEEAGGLIVAAGPVYTPTWAGRPRGDRRIDTIKALYPVTFYARGSAALNLGDFGSEEAWPLEFTRDGREAEFLWLEDDALASQQAWAEFDGVFGYYKVRGAKPGARVFARFSNPETRMGDELPVYLAAQFYGAGRVFFQASGEMWRLRALDDAYFDRYYTKLIRWVSQGRLLRDSSRGLLLADKDRCLLGDQVVVRAVLRDAQRRPLELDEVTATLVSPDGAQTPLTLRKVVDSPRPGMYAGQFTAIEQGEYRIELIPPGADVTEMLRRLVTCSPPQREMEQPQRNDSLLQTLAAASGGRYFVGWTEALDQPPAADRPPLAAAIEPQDQVTVLPGAPDLQFQRRLMTWLMALICGALCLEWLTRRLNRLA